MILRTFAEKIKDAKKYNFNEILTENNIEVRQIELPSDFIIDPIILGHTVTNSLFYSAVRDTTLAFKMHKNIYVFINNMYALVYGALYVEFMYNGNINKTNIRNVSVSAISHSDINIYVYDLCLQIITTIIKTTYADTPDELINSIIRSTLDIHKHVVEDSPTKDICSIHVHPNHDWASYMYAICNEDSVPLAAYFIGRNMLTCASIGNTDANLQHPLIH